MQQRILTYKLLKRGFVFHKITFNTIYWACKDYFF